MLTIKVIHMDGFTEVREAESVFMHPAEQSKLIQSFVYYFPPGKDTALDVRDGDIYVMNEHGKTIADYHIREPK